MTDREPEVADIRPRAIRVALSSVLVMVAAVAMLAGISQSMINYALPPDPSSGADRSGSAVWGPGAATSVFAGLSFLGSIGWLVWNARRRPSTGWWLLAVGLVAAAFVAAFWVAQLPHRSY